VTFWCFPRVCFRLKVFGAAFGVGRKGLHVTPRVSAEQRPWDQHWSLEPRRCWEQLRKSPGLRWPLPRPWMSGLIFAAVPQNKAQPHGYKGLLLREHKREKSKGASEADHIRLRHSSVGPVQVDAHNRHRSFLSVRPCLPC